jgi:hypothetical protein
MLNYVACDPNVKVVNLFHLVDETALEGWQSGLYFAGYAPKASAAAVAGWIAQTSGNCTGAAKSWTPTGAASLPVGGQTSLDPTQTGFASLGQLQLMFNTQQLFFAQLQNLTLTINHFNNAFGPALTNMDAILKLLHIGPYETSSARGLTSATAKKPVASAKALVKKGKRVKLSLKLPTKVKPGYYKLSYTFKAAKGGARATVTTKAFYLLGNGTFRK